MPSISPPTTISVSTIEICAVERLPGKSASPVTAAPDAAVIPIVSAAAHSPIQRASSNRAAVCAGVRDDGARRVPAG